MGAERLFLGVEAAGVKALSQAQTGVSEDQKQAGCRDSMSRRCRWERGFEEEEGILPEPLCLRVWT